MYIVNSFGSGRARRRFSVEDLQKTHEPSWYREVAREAFHVCTKTHIQQDIL